MFKFKCNRISLAVIFILLPLSFFLYLLFLPYILKFYSKSNCLPCRQTFRDLYDKLSPYSNITVYNLLNMNTTTILLLLVS